MSHLRICTWMTSAPPTIGPKESLRRARDLLHSAQAEELLVMENGKLLGMLNERDMWRHCPTSALMMDEQQVSELLEQFRVAAVMFLHPPVLAPDAQLAEAARLFAETGREGIVVVENGAPIGFLTEESFMRAAGLLLRGEWRRETKSES